MRWGEYSRAKQVYTQRSANEQNLNDLRSQFFIARRDLGFHLLIFSLTVDLRKDLPLSAAQMFKIYYFLPYFFNEKKLAPDIIIIGLYSSLTLLVA